MIIVIDAANFTWHTSRCGMSVGVLDINQLSEDNRRILREDGYFNIAGDYTGFAMKSDIVVRDGRKVHRYIAACDSEDHGPYSDLWLDILD